MKRQNSILLLVLLTCTTAAIWSCNSAKTKSVSDVDDYKKIAKEKYGEDTQFKHSPDEQFVLCYKDTKGTAKQPQNNISYFVYDLKKESIVLEDTFGPGNIDWYDNNKLEIFMIPGMMPANKSKADFTYIYNVSTGEKMTKSKYEKQ